jgi:multidrug efflux pump subunit AcrA (membrane-fusion protein)
LRANAALAVAVAVLAAAAPARAFHAAEDASCGPGHVSVIDRQGNDVCVGADAKRTQTLVREQELRRVRKATDEAAATDRLRAAEREQLLRQRRIDSGR